MKKQLLSILFGAAALSASAQMNDAGTGLTLTNSNGQSNCYANLAPGNGGIMAHGTSFNDGSEYIAAQLGPYVLVSKSDIESTTVTWFSIPIVVGEDSTAQCSNLYTEDTGIDMSSDGEVSFTAEASEAGAVLQFFLGSTGQWYPGSSTFSSDIIVAHTFAEANVQETFILDLSTEIGWSDWTGNAKVQSMGFRSQTPSATFSVYEIKLGADAYLGNNSGDNSGDGDTTVNNKTCNDLSENGIATYYNLIENGSTGRCSFNTTSIQGSDYGALDIGLLQEDNDAKYCGMCVEAKRINGNAVIVQIVDECPDCADRNADNDKIYKLDAGGNKILVETTADGDVFEVVNTKFGDIDLAPQTFEKVIGPKSEGVGAFSWKEVSCPWTSNLQVDFTQNDTWGNKIFVANHVNRIKSVEISKDAGANWSSMSRENDNSFTKPSFGGDSKSYKITDIYDEIIYLNDIDVTTQKSIVNAESNFPSCGLNTSTNRINTLNYVVAFPNPANNSITFDGVNEVETIEILNSKGQIVVRKMNLNSKFSQISLDVSNLASGIYVSKMTGSKSVGSVTFVKK